MNPHLLARRGWTQAGLLAAVLAVLVVGTTLLGTCALLLTTGQQRAQQAALRAAPADQLTAEVRLADLGDDPAGATATAAQVLQDALAPLPVSTSTWATSGVRDLPAGPAGERRLGYLADIDDLPDAATLTSGRWPVAPAGGQPQEVAVPAATATRLGLALGDQVALGPSLEPAAPDDTAPVTVLVVGTFTPGTGPRATWSRDLLGGAGSTARYQYGVFGRIDLPAFGPFVVAPQQLLRAVGGVDRVSLLAVPDLGGASAGDLADARAGLAAAPAALRAALEDRDTSSRVLARLPDTLAAIASAQAVTGSGVVVVALVGLALAGTALGLAGRLVGGRRGPELVLLTARGARRRQLVGGAVAESVVLAVLAAAAAVPLSLLLFGRLTALPALAGAGLSGAAAPTPALVATVLVGAALLATVLVVPVLRPAGREGRHSTRGLVVRSGADLVLVALAVVGWLQLRHRPAASAAGVDPLLSTAPVVCLLAGAVLVLRVVPVLIRLAERSAGRSRRLVLPLAAWQLARRPHATGAVFLLVLATAAAGFGLAFTSTWRASQTEQADARVGSALTVPAAEQDFTRQGATVQAAVGGTVSPVAVRPVALGTAVRTEDGTATRLVAVDTRQAGALLRGRLPDGETWTGLTDGLAQQPVTGLPLGAAPPIITGSTDRAALTARATLLVEDAVGSRLALAADPVPLDGAPHPLTLRDAAGEPPRTEGLSLVGLDVELELVDPGTASTAAVQLALQVPGAAPAPAGWSAGQPPTDLTELSEPTAAVTAGAGGAVLTAAAGVPLADLPLAPVHLVSTAAPPPAGLPVLVSADLADATGVEPGDRLALVVGADSLAGVVAGVVPYVPSLPGAPGVLADYQALARALTVGGSTDPLTTGWWTGGVPDPAGAVTGLADAGLPGGVTAAGLAEQLRGGPLRVGLLAAVALLVAAAGALALTGAALHTAAALQDRAVEVARLQGLGVPRRAVAGALVLEHTAVTTLAVGLGAVVGAAAAWLVAPAMTVTEQGAAPVPVPLPHWPWAGESLLVGGLLVGCTAVAVPVALVLGRRATAAHLRLDGGS